MPVEKEIPSLKKKLVDACLEKLRAKEQSAVQAMQQAQDTANEQRGSMGDKYETFRAQMQADRDMYARQLVEARDMIATLQKIDLENPKNSVGLGAIVFTGSKNFFVSAGLGALKLDEGTFIAISPKSPLFHVMAAKKANDTFIWQDKAEKIIRVS